jgi:hypothetical protein
LTRSRRWAPSIETLFVATVALLGLRLGLRAIGDNSTFVHLRTGIDMVDGLGIPRRDPYSFTAGGEPWVVQSWFASGVYGLLERVGGLRAVVVLHGALYAALAWMIATLCRTGSALRTAGAAIIAVGVGVPLWSPRPLAIGLVAMALTVLAVERGWRPWILVPVAWVWVNSHGSFVLGGLWLLLVVVTGRRQARTALAWFAGGVVLGALNPLGPRLLLFPLTVVSRRDNLARVVEWRPPSFRTPAASFGLVCLFLAAALIVGALWRRRLSLGAALPAMAFVALGGVSQRNLAPAAIALAPTLALVLGEKFRAMPGISRPERINGAFAGVIAAAAAVFVAAGVAQEPLDLDGYPSPRVLRAAGDAERMVTTDIVGGYRILREGRAADVFVDDRYDMYPAQVIADYVRLLDNDSAALAILERYRAGAVVWPADAQLAARLVDDRTWRRVLRDGEWVVFVRAG